MTARYLKLATVALIVSLGCTAEKETKILPHACELLSKTAVESLLGVSVGDPIKKEVGGNGIKTVTNCQYLSAPGGAMASVSLMVRQGHSSEDPAKAYSLFVSSFKKEMGPNHIVEKLPNFKDGAVWDPLMRQFTFFHGADMYVLAAIKKDLSRADVEAFAARLAAKIK